MKRLIIAALAAAPLFALGQQFPGRSVQMIIPYPAGGTTDVMARSLQEPLQRAWGQAVVVENKAGASGVLALREVARGKPDGHTLLFVNSGNLTVTPHVQKDAGFDGMKDFAPVALATTAPLFVLVPASLPVTDLKGFIDYAKKQPKALSYASAGVGSFGHLATELFAKAAGLELSHVPYRGQAPTTNAVLTGEVSLLITSMSGTMREFINTGRLKLLGVTSAQPSALAPNVPTVASVLPGYSAETWFGFVTTAGTPPAVVNRLNADINAAVQTKEVSDKFASLGMQVRTSTPDQLGAMIAADSARWGQVVRDNNIRAD